MIKKLSVILLLVLASCDYNPRCIGADDLGAPKAGSNVNGDDVVNALGTAPKTSWFKKTWSSPTQYVLTGEDLVIQMKGAWSGWKDDATFASTNEVCTVGSESAYTAAVATPSTSDDIDIVIKSNGTYEFKQTRPNQTQNQCWFTYGMGMYIGLSTNPRDSLEILYHLGDNNYRSQTSYLGQQGWYFILPAATLQSIKSDLGVDKFSLINIYSLIYTHDYENNQNGCIKIDSKGKPKLNPVDGEVTSCSTPIELIFKKGARRAEPAFLENVANYIMIPARNATEVIYKGVIASPTYRNIVTLTFILFISFVALGFLGGFLQITKKELLIMLMKLGIIIALINPSGGWQFFNQYVVGLFWDGSNQLTSMVLESFSVAVGSVSSVATSSNLLVDNLITNIDASILSTVDDALILFTSREAHAKISALLFGDRLGWLAVIVIYIAFFVFIAAVVKLTAVFIFVFLSMFILLSIAPIFLVFMLFNFTRQYFNSWMQALIGAAIQPMMLFVFIGIFLSIIITYLSQLLFFDVCWQTIIDIPGFKIGYWDITQAYNFNPEAVAATADKPAEPKGWNPKKGKLINNVEIEKQFMNIFLLLIFSLLMRYIIETVPKIADKISGGLSFSGVGAVAAKAVGAMEKRVGAFAGETAKSTVKGVHKRTTKRLGIAIANSKAVPKFLAKRVSGSRSSDLRKAKKELKKELRDKGRTPEEIKQAMKDGSLEKKLQERLERRKAKDIRYGRGTLNPLKIARGTIRAAKDSVIENMQKAQLRSRGKKMTKEDKKRIKNNSIRKELQQVQKGGKMAERASEIFNRKYAKKHLDRALRDVKRGHMGKYSVMNGLKNKKGADGQESKFSKEQMEQISNAISEVENKHGYLAKNNEAREALKDSLKEQGFSDEHLSDVGNELTKLGSMTRAKGEEQLRSALKDQGYSDDKVNYLFAQDGKVKGAKERWKRFQEKRRRSEVTSNKSVDQKLDDAFLKDDIDAAINSLPQETSGEEAKEKLREALGNRGYSDEQIDAAFDKNAESLKKKAGRGINAAKRLPARAKILGNKAKILGNQMKIFGNEEKKAANIAEHRAKNEGHKQTIAGIKDIKYVDQQLRKKSDDYKDPRIEDAGDNHTASVDEETPTVSINSEPSVSSSENRIKAGPPPVPSSSDDEGGGAPPPPPSSPPPSGGGGSTPPPPPSSPPPSGGSDS